MDSKTASLTSCTPTGPQAPVLELGECQVGPAAQEDVLLRQTVLLEDQASPGAWWCNCWNGRQMVHRKTQPAGSTNFAHEEIGRSAFLRLDSRPSAIPDDLGPRTQRLGCSVRVHKPSERTARLPDKVVEKGKAWKRSWMPPMSSRACNLASPHDEVSREPLDRHGGSQIPQAANCFGELFVAADYRGVFTQGSSIDSLCSSQRMR